LGHIPGGRCYRCNWKLLIACTRRCDCTPSLGRSPGGRCYECLEFGQNFSNRGASFWLLAPAHLNERPLARCWLDDTACITSWSSRARPFGNSKSRNHSGVVIEGSLTLIKLLTNGVRTYSGIPETEIPCSKYMRRHTRHPLLFDGHPADARETSIGMFQNLLLLLSCAQG
jgi:hypothetical protein